MGELASFSKGSGYSKSDLTDAGTPIILYGRLYTKYETVISKVDTFADAKSGSVYSKGGEVIVPGSGETAEDISIASVVENAGVLLGGDLNIITPPEEIDSAFLAISISNGKPHKDMAKMAQGKSVVHLHNSDLGKIDLPYPSMEEQRKISGTFANLDNLITLHQRKQSCNTLLINVWEQRKLGELVEFYNGDRSSRYPNDSDMVSEGVPFINAGDLVSGRVKLDTANKITEEKFNELSGAKIQRGDIIYCLRGTLGKNAFVDNFDVGTVASSLVDIRPKKVVGKYLYQVLNSDIEYTQRIVNDEGAAQPNLSAKNLSLFNIPMPDEVEQEKIAAYFDDLDNLITLHRRAYHYTKRRTYK